MKTRSGYDNTIFDNLFRCEEDRSIYKVDGDDNVYTSLSIIHLESCFPLSLFSCIRARTKRVKAVELTGAYI